MNRLRTSRLRLRINNNKFILTDNGEKFKIQSIEIKRPVKCWVFNQLNNGFIFQHSKRNKQKQGNRKQQLSFAAAIYSFWEEVMVPSSL